jgi:hypothetical protein
VYGFHSYGQGMSWILSKTPPIAGLFIDSLSGAIAVLVGFTGLFGGAAHYGAVLANRSDRDIERATGLGFFTGAVIGSIALVLDALT